MSCKFVCGKRQFLNTFIKLECIRGIRNSFTRPHVHLYLLASEVDTYDMIMQETTNSSIGWSFEYPGLSVL